LLARRAAAIAKQSAAAKLPAGLAQKVGELLEAEPEFSTSSSGMTLATP
jgi:hypothetical protein